MSFAILRGEIQEFLNFSAIIKPVDYVVHEARQEDGYTRYQISYTAAEGDTIPAYLLIPDGDGSFPAILLQHQHASQRHWGKSEVCGLVGDPFQAFAPILARKGFVVLAPDSICFEDRRRNQSGILPHESDGMQHFNEMCYRLTQGDTLMRKVLDDSALGISLLQHHASVLPDKIGTFGHSYGGNTVLFHAALDERIQFVCLSGAACSYQYKFENEIGLEMALVIPNFATRWDIHHLIRCIVPRHLLIMSADKDPNSQDVDKIFDAIQADFGKQIISHNMSHLRYVGEHALTQERFDAIIEWMCQFL
jgi:dienelactone hydrolase